MRIKKFRYIILIGIFLFAVIGFLLYSFYKKNMNNITDDINQNAVQIPMLYNVVGDYSINKMPGYSNEMNTEASDNVLSLVMEDFSIKFRITDADTFKVNGYEYSIRSFDTNELVENGDKTNLESEDIDLHLSSLIEENTEYLLELKLYTSDKIFNYYTRIIRSDTSFAIRLIDMANTFSNNNFDPANAGENSIYLESDGTGNSKGLEYVTLKSDFDMITYNGLKLAAEEKEVRLVNYNGYVGEVHFSFLASAEGKTYNIEENFICKSGSQRMYMLDYTRTMNEKLTGELNFNEKIDVGMNRNIKVITDNTLEKTAILADNKLFLVNGKLKKVDEIYKCKLNEYVMPLVFGDGLYFIAYGYNIDSSHIGDVGVSLIRYEENGNRLLKTAFIKVDADVGNLKNSIEELAAMGENGMLYLKLLDKVVGLDINSGNYVTIAEKLEKGKYSISEDESLLSWNVGDGLNIYNFKTGENKQLTNADEILWPIGYIGSDLVVAVESQNVLSIINGKPAGNIFEKVNIYNNLLEIQKEYSYENLYIDNIAVKGNRVHINLYQYDGEHLVQIGEDTIICSKSLNTDSKISSYTDSYKCKNYIIDTKKNVAKDISFAKDLDMNVDEIEYNIDVNSEYIKRMYYVYINSILKAVYDDPVKAVEDAYTYMGFVRRDGITVYARAFADNAASASFDAAQASEYVKYWENSELTRFRGITLKEAQYFITIKKPVFTFTAANNPVIIFSYDRTNVTVYDINSSSVQKIDINEAQNIFNSTQNDFSCFFTFAM